MLGKFFTVGAFLWSSLALADGVQGVFESDFPIMPKAECNKLVQKQAKKDKSINGVISYKLSSRYLRKDFWYWAKKHYSTFDGKLLIFDVLYRRRNKDLNGIMVGNEVRKVFAKLNKDNDVPKKLITGQILEGESGSETLDFFKDQGVFDNSPMAKGVYQRVTEIGTKNGKCYVQKEYVVHPKSMYVIFDKDFCRAVMASRVKASECTKQKDNACRLKIDKQKLSSLKEKWRRHTTAWRKESGLKQKLVQRLEPVRFDPKIRDNMGPLNLNLLKSANELSKTCQAYEEALEPEKSAKNEAPQQPTEESKITH